MWFFSKGFLFMGIGVMIVGGFLAFNFGGLKDAFNSSSFAGEEINVEKPLEVGNFYETDLADIEEQQKVAEDFWVEYKLERERTRGQQLENLREIIQFSKEESEAGEEAKSKLLEINNYVAKENQIENLLKAKGILEVAVYFDEKGVILICSEMEEEIKEEIEDILAHFVDLENSQIIFVEQENEE